MSKHLLVIIVAGYVVYKIGWVDGLTPVNLFLLLCLGIIAAASLLRHTQMGKRLRDRRDEEIKAYEDKQKKE